MWNIRFVSNTVQHTLRHMHNSLPLLPISFSDSWSVQQKQTNKIQDTVFVIFCCSHKPLCCDLQPPNKPYSFFQNAFNLTNILPTNPTLFLQNAFSLTNILRTDPILFLQNAFSLTDILTTKPCSVFFKRHPISLISSEQNPTLSFLNASNFTDILWTKPYSVFSKCIKFWWTSAEQIPTVSFQNASNFMDILPTKPFFFFKMHRISLTSSHQNPTLFFTFLVWH